MHTFQHRAGSGCQFQYFHFLIAETSALRKANIHFYLSNSPGAGDHYLFHLALGANHIYLVRGSRDSHGGYHAGREGCGYKVGRRKLFTFSVIINWCIRFYSAA